MVYHRVRNIVMMEYGPAKQILVCFPGIHEVSHRALIHILDL